MSSMHIFTLWYVLSTDVPTFQKVWKQTSIFNIHRWFDNATTIKKPKWREITVSPAFLFDKLIRSVCQWSTFCIGLVWMQLLCRVEQFLGMRHSKNPPTFRWKCDVLKSSRNWLFKRLKLAKNYDQQKSQITSCSPPKSHVFNFGPDVATNQFEVLSWGNGCVSWDFITKRLQKLPNIKSRCW